MSLDKRIGFLGGGNMAEALIRGLLHGAQVPAQRIIASDPRQERLEELHNLHGIRTTADNAALVADADIIVLAVKPQVLLGVLDEVRHNVPADALIISIAAGVTTAVIESHLADDTRVVRTMPNTPALVQTGATAVAAGKHASAEDVATAKQMFDAVGVTVVVPERQLDAVTGLSGSGPAYIFLVVESLIEAGVSVGLSETDARLLAVQTVAGAARLMVETGEPPAELRRKVTSPGGTTVAGLGALDQRDLRGTLVAAVQAATLRSAELGRADDE